MGIWWQNTTRWENADNGSLGSEPIVIAQTILKSINSSKHKTRYAVGGDAKLILLMRRILSDRMFDGVFMSQMK